MDMEDYQKIFIKKLIIWTIKAILFLVISSLVISLFIAASMFLSVFGIPLITVICVILYIYIIRKNERK